MLYKGRGTANGEKTGGRCGRCTGFCHPGGVPALVCNRWASNVRCSGSPPGCRGDAALHRWCRRGAPQPSATCCQASGLGVGHSRHPEGRASVSETREGPYPPTGMLHAATLLVSFRHEPEQFPLHAFGHRNGALGGIHDPDDSREIAQPRISLPLTRCLLLTDLLFA